MEKKNFVKMASSPQQGIRSFLSGLRSVMTSKRAESGSGGDLQIGLENFDTRQSTECRWSY
jgi:hypothetical protein